MMLKKLEELEGPLPEKVLAWSDEAYRAMLRVLRKSHGEQDLIYDAALKRLVEVWGWKKRRPRTQGQFVGLCLMYAEKRAVDVLRSQGRRGRRWVPLEEVPDRRAEPGREEVAALLRFQEACLARLPVRRRKLLEMYYEQGLSDREIAWRRVRKKGWPRLPGVPEGEGAEKELAEGRRRRAEAGRRLRLEAARKAVSRERRAALEGLRLLVEAEAARAECPAT